MAVDKASKHRRSIRLPGYDYASAGAYFVTLVAWQRECLFGMIEHGTNQLTTAGEIISAEWLRSGEIRAEVTIDAFVVMPNHVHGIIFITGTSVGAHGRAPLRGPVPPTIAPRQARSLGSLIAGFKSASTKRINILRDGPGVPVWQRNYYERIIRNEAELNRIRRYILDNPAKWHEDPENPAVDIAPC